MAMLCSKRLFSATLRRTLSTFEYLQVEKPAPKVYNVQLNRPDKRNALNMEMWAEVATCFKELSATSDCRVIILSGNGKAFCAGIDLASFISLIPKKLDAAHKALELLGTIKGLQDGFTTMEHCNKPVIGAIHGSCIGGGIDVISSTDIRLASHDAVFQIKEVDIGIAADVGTLQRLPKIVGNQSVVNELALTARKFHADEALRIGLVSNVYTTKSEMMEKAVEMALVIASKSPVAVQGTKNNIVYARDHTVQEGLDRIALWNSVMLQGGDPMIAMTGGTEYEDA